MTSNVILTDSPLEEGRNGKSYDISFSTSIDSTSTSTPPNSKHNIHRGLDDYHNISIVQVAV